MSSIIPTVISTIIVVMVSATENVVPPMVFLACHIRLGDLGANHLPPAHDFLRLVVARRAVLDGIIVTSQLNDFIVLYGGALAVSGLLARRQYQY